MHGSYLFTRISNLPALSAPAPNHYQINVVRQIDVPEDSEFRSGYYFWAGGNWFYRRNFFGKTLAMRMDLERRVFEVNYLYARIPFELGGIFPAGRHIADLINLQLFRSGVDIIRGCAFRYDGEAIAIAAPSGTGKTALVKQLVLNGAEYIAEDILVIDGAHQLLYSTMPRTNYGRSVNRQLLNVVRKHPLRDGEPLKSIYLLSDFGFDQVKQSWIDFYGLNALMFLGNPWIRALLFQAEAYELVGERLRRLQEGDETGLGGLRTVFGRDDRFNQILRELNVES